MITNNAKFEDIDAILNIYHIALKHMHEEGNDGQWFFTDDQFVESIRKYIDDNNFYVVKENDEIIAFYALIIGEDPTYVDIKGKWLNNQPYAAIHRIAVKYHRKGIFSNILKDVEEKLKKQNIFNIKIDTSSNNVSMINSLLNKGFVKCGIISIYNDFTNPSYLRDAYQKALN